MYHKEVHLLGVEEEIEHKTKYTAGSASYIERNYAMINASDYCIFYYDENYLPEYKRYSKKGIGFYQPNSGTALAYSYAKRKNKIIINIFEKQLTKLSIIECKTIKIKKFRKLVDKSIFLKKST